MGRPRERSDRLFGAACLKLTLEKSGAVAQANEIYKGALEDLELEDAEVDAFLREHRPAVESRLAERGRRPTK